jgi:hypothetical protein
VVVDTRVGDDYLAHDIAEQCAGPRAAGDRYVSVHVRSSARRQNRTTRVLPKGHLTRYDTTMPID